MSDAIRTLEPQAIWNNFADLNAVPRASKKEAAVIAFIKAFGAKLNLPTYEDEVGNVIIKKPASPGMEDKQTIVLQSHLDMVHQKNNDTVFNFATQGIEMFVDADWVKAKGTTLGADNGIGVATIMTLLETTTIAHPALEALFTIDEETGMTGALALKGGLLDGTIMLNLDTEEDNELTIGCAGGVDVTGAGSYTQLTPKHTDAFKITVNGLTGGHSGIDIHKGRGNANKIMNRLLLHLFSNLNMEIASIDGGSLRNAIPRESNAIICVENHYMEAFKDAITSFGEIIKEEYRTTDPNVNVSCATAEAPKSVMPQLFIENILRTIYTIPNGIYRMSPEINGLVQTSNNLSRVLIGDGVYSIQNLTRSSVDTEKTDLKRAITCSLEMLGATVTYGGSYPGWAPKPDAAIVKIMSGLYQEMFNEPALVNACHAGLECGILGTNYPEMQMISFGPTIHGAHSPDEKVSIPSVQKYWKYLQETLKRIPSKN
jgi:dipeptidase D